jgi:hypothetical protein
VEQARAHGGNGLTLNQSRPAPTIDWAESLDALVGARGGRGSCCSVDVSGSMALYADALLRFAHATGMAPAVPAPT